MPTRRKKPTTDVRLSENGLTLRLSQFMGLRQLDSMSDMMGAYEVAAEQSEELESVGWIIRRVTGFYPWRCDVAGEVMGDTPGPLVEHLVMRCGSFQFAVDTNRAGRDALWVVAADAPGWDEGITRHPNRTLSHTFETSPRLTHVVAIQLSSCLPRK